MDVSRVMIKDLVQSTIKNREVLPHVTFFGLSQKARGMISTLDKLSDSILLRQFWMDSSHKAVRMVEQGVVQKQFLGIDDVEDMIWSPCYSRLQSLQVRFINGNISFKEIDKCFAYFKENQAYRDLAKEIKLVISKSGSEVKASDLLIDQRVDEIKDYHKLRHCVDAAAAIWDFKVDLGLEGDFSLVDELRNQVCLSCQIKRARKSKIFNCDNNFFKTESQQQF